MSVNSLGDNNSGTNTSRDRYSRIAHLKAMVAGSMFPGRGTGTGRGIPHLTTVEDYYAGRELWMMIAGSDSDDAGWNTGM